MSYAILWVVQGIMEKKMDPAPRHVKLSYGSEADANFSTNEFWQVTWCNKSCFQCQILMLHLMLKRQNPFKTEIPLEFDSIMGIDAQETSQDGGTDAPLLQILSFPRFSTNASYSNWTTANNAVVARISGTEITIKGSTEACNKITDPETRVSVWAADLNVKSTFDLTNHEHAKTCGTTARIHAGFNLALLGNSQIPIQLALRLFAEDAHGKATTCGLWPGNGQAAAGI